MPSIILETNVQVSDTLLATTEQKELETKLMFGEDTSLQLPISSPAGEKDVYFKNNNEDMYLP